MIALNQDDQGLPQWKPAEEDPVIGTLMAMGLPVAQPQLQDPYQLDPVYQLPPSVLPPTQAQAPVPAATSGNPLPSMARSAGVNYSGPINPGGGPPAGWSTTPGLPPPPPPGPPAQEAALKSGDVAGAQSQVDASLQGATTAQQDTALAKTSALADHAEAKARVYEGHATAQGLVDNQYQIVREAARRDAEAETAAWQKDLDRKISEEPVPSRWFDSQNGFGKVMWVLSLAFGSLAQAKNPALRNVGLEMISAEIDADINRQKDRLAKELDSLKFKGDKIDKRLQSQLADLRDDYTLKSSRLAVIQQAAMERANAPGAADVKAAYSEAAAWAQQERLKLAGAKLDRAYSERESKLGRDAENARAWMVDKRTRDIANLEDRRERDLARISIGAKLSEADAKAAAEKYKDLRALSPDITGVRVVDKAGKPVGPGGQGALMIDKDRDKEVLAATELAQHRYDLLKQLSRELDKGEDWKTLLKQNPKIVSLLQQVGYSTAKDMDPRGVVTDKDLVNGLEGALGGDLTSLSGRIASGTFAAGQGDLKKVVDDTLLNMPKNYGLKLGKFLDVSPGKIEGYDQPGVRVDWTPKDLEQKAAPTPTGAQINAQYGISTPLKTPQTVAELEEAQQLESKGIEALPPHRPGVKEQVQKTLNDFKGALPWQIEARGAVATKRLDGVDRRGQLEVLQGQLKATTKAEETIQRMKNDLNSWMGRDEAAATSKEGQESLVGSSTARGAGGPSKAEVKKKVADLASKYGFNQMTATDMKKLVEAVTEK